jgi:hypothetical protein
MLMSGTYTLLQVAKDLEDILNKKRNTHLTSQDTATDTTSHPSAAQGEPSQPDRPTS